MDGNFGVVLFYSTSAAIRTEKLIKNSGFKVKLISVPRQLSSDCGISLRFNINYKDEIVKILKKEEVEYDSIHKL
ncbi:hypothetical protein AMJ80_02035 [bacterium SM23_31]|nr:MAG: hypothetical protein AMJ80_02035 [bacterium SM23_31]